MSVAVRQLSKIYGAQKAVNDISFDANEGQVLGFLGPNGAGKTTTMKMITGYTMPSNGHIEVCGFNVYKDSIKCRQQIGYLPEHNPLYKDMYVKEYLQFIAGLHKISSKKQRVAEMIELTGLEIEQHKKIGMLSKGYRQRVGLAQAMIHDPQVLILDEPTSGLDPNQLVDIRNLIRTIGKEKTVIFSTHIMQEVQAVCDRVIIINRGQIVVNETIDKLQFNTNNTQSIIIEVEEPCVASLFEKIPALEQVIAQDEHKWKLIFKTEKDVRAEVYRFVVSEGLTLLELKKEKVSIENIFQNLTK